MNGLFGNFVGNKSIYVEVGGVINKILFVVGISGDMLNIFWFGIVVL